jgi:tubulin-folding cofactor B
MSIVVCQVTSDVSQSERRLDKHLTITELKIKLEPITGIPSGYQYLDLYKDRDFICTLEGYPDMKLGAFPVENHCRIHACGVSVHLIKIGDGQEPQQNIRAVYRHVAGGQV